MTTRDGGLTGFISIHAPRIFYYLYRVGHGLGVACWPLVPKFAGSNPAEDVGFLGRKKS